MFPIIFIVLAFLFIISIIFKFNTLSENIVYFFLLTLIPYVIWKVIKIALSIEKKESENKLFKSKQDIFLKNIEKYVHVLYKKKQLAISRNDYGLLDANWWNKEKINFLSNLKHQYNLDLTDQDCLNLIDYAVDNYIEEDKFINEIPTNPYEYEEYCATLLNQRGWTTKITKGSGDHGVDILATINGKSIAIQCKLYNSSVGNQAIQEVVTGMKFWEASVAIVVTNSNYTKHAIEIARVHNVYLLHHDDLHQLDIIIRNPPIYLQ